MSQASLITQQQWQSIGQSDKEGVKATTDKDGLIQQNFAVLERLLMKLVLHRSTRSKKTKSTKSVLSTIDETMDSKRQKINNATKTASINDVYNEDKKIIHAKAQLLLYVKRIAELYRNVHYHNLQHATHVTLSANKLIDILLSCKYNDQKVDENADSSSEPYTAETFERYLNTFGISEDPLVHFALVFSALVHDVEHKGLPNAQLIQEQDKLSFVYINKSVAEQHSIAVAFSILSEPCFNELRNAIWCSKYEFAKFRGLVVNLILATDISSPERTAIGREKWNTAFSKDPVYLRKSKIHRRRSEPSTRMSSIMKRDSHKKIPRASETNLSCAALAAVSLATMKSNAILEQLMQIADVAHLMQDWPVFTKWNKKLYDELWAANLAKRGFDPSKNWCNGQTWFLENYVIPLSKRINDSGIFGSQGAVFMENAIKNRDRWLVEGEAMTDLMITNVSYVSPNFRGDSETSVLDDTTLHRSSGPNRTARTTRAA